MKKIYTHKIVIACLSILVGGATLTSCEKIPGHSISPTVTTSTGSTGTTGTTGTTGSTGTTGTTGTTGSTGSTGTTGSTGSTGSSGFTGSTTGIGPIAVGSANTIIFQVNGGTVVTLNASAHTFGLTSVSFFGITQTTVSVVSGSNPEVILGFTGNTTGLYSAGQLQITTGGYNVSNDYYSEPINVTTCSLTGTTTGVIKGTFDGLMTDNNQASKPQVRVSGSFYLNQ